MLQTPSTIIVLRHDSAVRWEQSNVVLHKGELGIAYLDDGKVIVKAGDGSNVWEELPTIDAMLNKKVDAAISDLAIAQQTIATNSTDIATLLPTVKTNQENINKLIAATTNLQELTTQHAIMLSGVKSTVVETIQEAIDALVLPKSSDEITVEEDGKLTLKEVSTDKLVQGEEVIVLDSGSSVV